MKLFRAFILLYFLMNFAGCNRSPSITYHPDDFINPNKVVVRAVKIPTAPPVIHASFPEGEDQALQKAFHHFSQTGRAPRIQSKGFVTYPYDRYQRPIVACAPLHLCVIQLEQGEKVNHIDIGDAAHWMVDTAYVGTLAQGSTQILIKPKQFNIATDLMISTHQRVYHIGLLSEAHHRAQVVRFYYPQATLAAMNQRFQQRTQALQKNILWPSTLLALNHLNFNYSISGDTPVWRPVRVFDDGQKTLIQMPPAAAHFNLPVLYLKRDRQWALVNYRYRRPYYIIDGLFQQAYLISGKGRHQVKVALTNHQIQGRAS